MNSDKEISQMLARKWLWGFVICAILALILLLTFQFGCDREPQKVDVMESKYDSLYTQFSALQQRDNIYKGLITKQETVIRELKLKQPEVKIKYITIRQQIPVNVCDTLKTLALFDSLYSNCNTRFKHDSLVISEQEVLIGFLHDDLAIKDSMLNNTKVIDLLQNIELDSEKSAHKETKKKLNKQKVKTALVGVLGAIGIGAIIVL